MTYHEFTCTRCGETTTIRWLAPTRVDPGCWEDEPECSGCGNALKPEDGEPAAPPEPDPDAAHDLHR